MLLATMVTRSLPQWCWFLFWWGGLVMRHCVAMLVIPDVDCAAGCDGGLDLDSMEVIFLVGCSRMATAVPSCP